MSNSIYIFGAHSRARTIAYYLKYLDASTKIEAYLINDDEANDTLIDNVPVLDIRSNILLDNTLPVYIGTRGISFSLIAESLGTLGFTDIRPVTVELDLNIRNQFLEKYYKEKNVLFEKLTDNSFASNEANNVLSGSIYVIASSFDKPLKTSYKLADYETPLQVGVSLSDVRISTVLDKSVYHYDNEGDNISARNRQFCETTGSYYLWKNVALCNDNDYIGMCHYRRHFILPDNWREQMIGNDIDVILPIPLYVAPSVADNYRFRHGALEWDVMMKYLKEMYPDMYIAAEEYFSDGLYCPCNMFIAKREAFIELCEFMFPILFKLAEECGVKEDSYQNRYPAFMAERLLSFFFEYNRGRYHLVYADKNFLE